MPRRKKQNIIKRYFRVLLKRLRRLRRMDKGLWLRRNFKQHPFVLGIVLYIWIIRFISTKFFIKISAPQAIAFHAYLFALWLVLAVVSNLLRDKGKVKWFLKKRFIFFLLLVFPPLGIVFLWLGSKFRTATKIVLSIIFGALIVIKGIHYTLEYDRVLNQTSFDGIVELITKPKKEVYLKAWDEGGLKDLKLSAINPKKKKNKLAVSDIAERCNPAIVSIETKTKDGKDLGLGSGFLISKDGIIVTNFHVVESAYGAKVKIGEKEFSDVYFIKGLPQRDIALLKVDGEDLPFLPIGDTDKLVTGQFVVVLGNPIGFERSVSTGIISAIRSKGDIRMIQTTAPVSPGSSGGPVVNEYGEVVGIATIASFLMTQNLNFAIPINYLNRILEKEKSGKR